MLLVYLVFMLRNLYTSQDKSKVAVYFNVALGIVGGLLLDLRNYYHLKCQEMLS